jgi:predicted DNA-binding protein with PD1-like motif
MYYSKCNIGYVLRLEVGEEIQETLRQFGKHVGLKAATYQGIGTLTRVELAFFCTDLKVYDRHFFDDEYELISLLGNLSMYEDEIAPHTHVALGTRHFQTISGHLVRGVVSVTAEIFVTPVDIALTREEDPILKFKGLISPHRTHLKIDV